MNDTSINDAFSKCETEYSKELKPYIHLAKYYETDQMAVIHHSNYIRWFEEARVDFLEQIGLGYDKIEDAGIYSPVLGVECEFKSAVRFNEKIFVIPKLVYFNGFKMTIEYRVLDVDSHQLRARGETKHCFVTNDFKPVNLKKDHKDMYDILLNWTGINIKE
ncbi:acyl-CoA thioesterase [Mobilitalea sibirica]|uniref:Acyl-CoA thioesterase n=1 Tax=Mobilitalea sibirica TaxID=1462919 RepID=A0A8J7KZS4_9FIRM|nr:thioesterase family protein [Mobilitalea sibirica]MBH1940848.1 acyl-CoA thioesterase [Mobilitalea sibirica]